MKTNNENTAHNQLLKSIIDYNTVNLLNKSELEIINAGLRVYNHIPECSSASLFVLDQNSFEFHYKTSTDTNLENDIKGNYDKLIDKEVIADVLTNLDIVECKLSTSENAFNQFIVAPLVTPKGIIAIVLISLKADLNDKETLFGLIKHHSDNFALRIQNTRYDAEVTDIKTELEKKIALSTKDIVQSSRELKLILDSVQMGIIIVEKDDDTILDANTKAAEIMGTTKELMIGTKRGDHFFLLDKRYTKRLLNISQESLIRNADGSLVPVIASTYTIRIDEQDSYIISFVDITDRKKAEEALQQAHFELERRVEERTLELSQANKSLQKEIHDREKAEADILKLYWAVHQSPVSVIITNLEGSIEYVNPQFCEMTGYKFEEIVGRNPRILKSGEITSEKYSIIWKKLTSGGEWRGEFRNKKKDGELFWVSAALSSVRNNDGEITHYLGIEEDITEAKQSYQDLVEAKERAEESDKLKSQILANMNHEFRTPLIGILGFSQVLQSDHLDVDQMEMVDSIYLSGKRLLATSDGILTLSQLESQQKSLNPERINIADQIHDSLENFLTEAVEKKLKLYVNVHSEQVWINADKELLNESIGYLVDNAIKYTDTGSITISVGQSANNKAYIKIEDTGLGIQLEHHKIIFEAFRQASEGYARSFEGCGLGLTIAKKYVELMNGEITLESEFSVGSTFTIWIPVSEQ